MQYLAEGINTVTEFKERVDELFKDHGQEGDHQLTSAHKSKGLEKDTVCIYKPSKLPLPPPKKKKGASYSYEQEKNLTYVAYTRAMDTLMFVIEDKKTRDMDI
jgi:superfamily I DNA/RNA helicase